VVIAWPNPAPGQPDQVVVDSIPMEMVPGKYAVEEADRFGEKVSQGTLKYADFNPYESAHAVAALTGGAGLRRYSDAGDDPTQFATRYPESPNVNCAFAPVVLSPEVTYNALPSATGPAVWIGEILYFSAGASVQRLLCVAPMGANTGVYMRQSVPGPWQLMATITGKGPPLGAACGVFGNLLTVGFGGQSTGVVVDSTWAVHDVLQAAGEPGGAIPIYVWAYTSDHASNYIAGGPGNADYYKVMSSISPLSGYAQPVSTGNDVITALAPGGGLVLVYVGKTSELGEIDNNAVYHALIPYTNRSLYNTTPLRWMLASGADQARGSLTLVFPRERSLWEYVPADQFSGSASVIAPWAQTYRRPPNARGRVTALVGSTRFLYYAVQNNAGHTWIYRNDQTTGAPHTYLDLGNVDVRALEISFIFSPNPILTFSSGTNMGQVTLPQDGDMELDDPNCRFQAQGYVDIPDIDLGFPDEDKIGFTVRVIGDNLAPGARYFDVQYGLDGGALSDMGNIISSPSGEVRFPLQTEAKRIRLRIWFYSNDNTQSPELWGFSLRVSLNTKVYRLFVFQTRLPASSFSTLADDLSNPYTTIQHMWQVRAAGFPVPFADPWNDAYQARLIKLQVQEALREPAMTPEWVLDFTLLEFLPGTSSLVPVTSFVYDMDWTTNIPANPDLQNQYGYDMPLAIYDASQ